MNILLSFLIMINGFNIYSPDLVRQNNQLVMYFGGWMDVNEVPYDGIYRSVCTAHNLCGTPTKVISMPQGNLQQVNDPTLVQMPGGYWIMYMTGSTSLSGELSTQGVYYATSWDGGVWSSPQLLIQGYWLPSAVLKDGRVYLYTNPTVAPNKQWRFDLGTSGVAVGTPIQITHSQPYNYSNVDVTHDRLSKLWFMLGENLGTMPSTNIDFLYSHDGENWILGNQAVVTAQPNGSIRTPAFSPESNCCIYYALSPTRDGMNNKIYFIDLTP